MVVVDSIPLLLREQAHWVCWKEEVRKGKPTKVPYNARTQQRASSTDESTWVEFAVALQALARYSYNGIGFAFSQNGDIVGVDLDWCRDPSTGVLAPWALAIVRHLNSYTEITPSGRGLHVLCRGTWTGIWNNRRGPKREGTHKTEGVEVYQFGKYFTVTGAHLEGTPLEVEERTAELSALAVMDLAIGKKPTQRVLVASEESPASALTDTDLQRRMFESKLGDKIRRLWDGDDGGDHSAADWDLIDHLLYWTEYDSIRTDRLFRASGLMRDKWDETHYSNGETYGAGTIRRRMERKLKTRSVEPVIGEAEPGQIVTAADLQKMVFPPRVHVVDNLITKGLTVLAGKSKFGKSWMILDISIAVAEGGVAMGAVTCQQGSVLYLALEDGLDRIQERMEVLIGDRPWPAKLHLVTEWPTMDDPHCLDPIETWLKKTPDAKMVVIDVFQRFRPQASKGLNMYQQDYKDAAPLQAFARQYSVAVVLLHHVNKLQLKDGDDIFDAISGSTGLPGAADTPMVLRKINKTNATLYLRGRDVGELEYALVWNQATAGWTIVGDAETVTVTAERREVLALFAERRSLSVKFVAEELNLTAGTARKRLFDMKRAGIVLRDGEGAYTQNPAYSPPQPASNASNAVTRGNAVTAVTPESVTALLSVTTGHSNAFEGKNGNPSVVEEENEASLHPISQNVTALPWGGVRLHSRVLTASDEGPAIAPSPPKSDVCPSCNTHWLTASTRAVGRCRKCLDSERN